jgi:hypothetical protein
MPFASTFKAAFLGLTCLGLAGLSACGGGGSKQDEFNIEAGVFGPNVSGTPDSFRGAGVVNADQFLFGGPLARGRQGDVLLQNDQVRIIIQKPGRSAGVGMFGGNVIDADRFRPSSERGQDQFGAMFPLINLAWTVNYQRLEIINADFGSGPVVLRATGVLDVYDYIQTNIIVPFAKVAAGADLFYASQFDDVFDPFKNVPGLRDFNPVIVTDYTLKPDAGYLIIETHLQNDGAKPIQTVVGDWVNGSGNLELFVPKKGFVRKAQIDGATALVYQGLEDNVDVSYGYFYNPIQFSNEDGTLRNSAALSVSGVTPMVLGEESLLNVIPLGDDAPTLKFSIDPGTRTITRYFAIGRGDIASVMDEGFKALGVSKLRLSGKVVDGNGDPVPRARVVVLDGESPVTSAYSDASGEFAQDISSGRDAKDQIFGSGSYTVQVYKEGYAVSGSSKAGKCSGGNLDSSAMTVTGVKCTMGGSAVVNVSVDSDGAPGPARLTIVGFDPSPFHTPGQPEDFAKLHEDNLEERPYGIVDMFYIDPSGRIFPEGHSRRVGDNSFRLEPGEYEFFVTRGPEYSVFKQRITVTAGGAVPLNASLSKVLDTGGSVSADFHMHGIQSADSIWSLESRVRGALAEGMDVLVSSDHDYVTDYAPTIQALGVGNLMTSIAGDEITPLAFGHLGVYPIEADPSSPTGGAYDYTYLASDDPANPDRDAGQTLDQIFDGVEQAYSGTQVLQMNHIMDKATGNFAISGLVTSPFFNEVEPLSTYADPVKFRMPANSNEAGGFQAPFPLGTTGMFSTKFTAIELTIGAYADTLDHLMQTALPTYFNLLNLGLIRTAVTNSDSHTQVREPVGTPRNYVMVSTDPRDGIGSSFQAIDPEELAASVNAHRSIASNGIFIKARLKSAANPSGVTVGGTLQGSGDVTLELEIASNEYFDWDQVEIYANTEPIPAKDDLSGVTDKSASDFHAVTSGHIAKYLMSPIFQFTRGGSGDSALTQTVSGGLRHATLTRSFHFDEDTWVLVLARGTGAVRSLFPYVTKAANKNVDPADFLDTLDSNPAQIGGIRSFAFTNPMFVDVDGNGFQAKYIREGTSPLAK